MKTKRKSRRASQSYGAIIEKSRRESPDVAAIPPSDPPTAGPEPRTKTVWDLDWRDRANIVEFLRAVKGQKREHMRSVLRRNDPNGDYELTENEEDDLAAFSAILVGWVLDILGLE